MHQSVSICPSMLQASERVYAPTMLVDAPSNAHTDRQTYKHQLTLLDHLTLSNARRGAAKFDRPRGENRRPAAAARGIKAES